MALFPSVARDAHPRPVPAGPRRRADAERSVARILDATVDCLGQDPEASMAEIARRAGVVRATIYVHFPTREALVDAVTEHAVAEVSGVIAAAEPDQGEPAEALARVVSAAWRSLGRYHRLVEMNSARPAEDLHGRHGAALAVLEPLVVRGQQAGAFRADVPPAWHLAAILALVHAAVGELRTGRVGEDEVEPALVASVLGSVGARP